MEKDREGLRSFRKSLESELRQRDCGMQVQNSELTDAKRLRAHDEVTTESSWLNWKSFLNSVISLSTLKILQGSGK